MIKDELEKILGFEVEATENSDFGDYTSNIAFKSKTPVEKIVDDLRKNKKLAKFVDKIEAVGKFINFLLKKDVLIDNLIQIEKERGKYGDSTSNKGKKIILEFTDPNPFKEFHIGHVYTNTVGESLSRLLAATGAVVRRANYQGDVGLHVAKAIWGLKNIKNLEAQSLTERIKIIGQAYAEGSRAYEEDNVAKIEINSLNQKIFESDPEVMDLYKKGRKWSLDYFETIYKRLGTKFDNYYFESEVGKVGQKIVEENLKKGIFEKSKGAIIFPGSKYGLHDRVFINSLGLPTYEAKELGLAPTKHKDFAYDLSIIITANEINEYFKVLIKVMSLIYPDLGKKTLHIGHGMVRLPEGKMSSRTGKIVTGESLLDEVKNKAAKINKDSSEMVAIAAVKYAFLKVGIGKDIIYDIGESLSLEGNSGPYLQYTVARCNSVLSKIGKLKIGNSLETENWKLEIEELAILRKLSQFQEIIMNAAKTYSPNLLCNYLYDLASKFNTFYNKHKIIGSENENFRLVLTEATGQVLKNGLNLLGIKAPERM